MDQIEIEDPPVSTRNGYFSWRKILVGISALGVAACTATAVALTTTESESISSFSFDAVSNASSTNRYSGLQSIYRYNCDDESVKCTPLDDYVWRDNKDYKYSVDAVYDHPLELRPTRTIIVNMTSQNWLTEEEVTRTLWWHEMIISIPYDYDQTMQRSAVMLIDGGSNKPGRIISEDDSMVRGCQWIAKTTRTICAVLKQVPNERLYFLNDPRMGESGRTEDEIIAWTWRHFMDHPDQPDWLLRLPMTKAARLALDTVDAVFKDNRLSMGLSNMRSPIDQFLVTGASKRGWTTWTIASVDKRVKALAPMVLDCLNMETLFPQWYQNLGGWSFALSPYYDEGLTADFGSPNFAKMAAIIDPYYYRDRLVMPKMVISATGDEFFNIDDSYSWFKDMKGPTYLRLLPNAEHGMIPPQALSSPSIVHGIRAFYLAVMRKYPLPEVSWKRGVDEDQNSWITVTTSTKPSLINAWTADTKNSTRRDFRWARMKTDSVDWPTNGPSKTADKIDSFIIENEETIGGDFNLELEPKVTDLYGISEEDIQFQPIKWNRIIVSPVGEDQWHVSVPPSYSGFRAVMIEMTFQGSDDRSQLTFTSEVMITPDSRPFEACSNTDCYGYLL